jgi:hypothetical protein
MHTLRRLLAVALVAAMAPASTAAAQDRHAVSPSTIASAISGRLAEDAAARAAVREALGRAEVGDVATRVGIELDVVRGAVDTLEGDDLDRAASAARQVNQALVGGQNITFSATTIIIILLVVILIIVAVD